MTWYRTRRYGRSSRAVLPLALLAAAGLAACSSGASSSSAPGTAGSQGSASSASSGSGAGGTSSATTACMAAAAAYLKPFDTLPTKLPASYTPLPSAPPRGKKIIQLVSPIPSDQQSFQLLKVAATAIGWTASSINFDGTVADLNQKFEQAISDKPDVILSSGFATAALQRPLADAKAAGIIVSLDSEPDNPTSYPGFADASDGPAAVKSISDLQAYLFMRDSNCAGSVDVLSLSGYQIITDGVNQFIATVKAHCPACKVNVTGVPASAIGTPAATSAVVSSIQASPATKYVFAVIANLAVGLPAALAQGNITGVKIFGQTPDATAVAALRNGTNAWWVEESPLMQPWTALDATLRAMETHKPVLDNPNYPLAVLTPANISQSSASVPTYPLDYESEFKALWHVGG
jgi:ABC-type sugar transport system substrate-binding protein